METVLTLTAIPLLLIAATMSIPNIRQLRCLESFMVWLHLLLVAKLVYPLLTGEIRQIVVNQDLVIDRLAAMFLLLTVFIAACSFTHGQLYFAALEKSRRVSSVRADKITYVCANALLLAMSLVFLCRNLGYLWIAIEATTFASAPLICYVPSKSSLEATWKYLIICSVGIAFALLGTVFIFASSQHGLNSTGTLNTQELTAAAGALQQPLPRLGFVFCFLGYGTKAGMFPVHSWLPDAYSEAPAPAAAMLSGALVNCALFGIWRVVEILLASHSRQLVQNMIIPVGTLTVIAASLFLVRQHGFKRLWAYSSIENVGLMLVSIGLGSGVLFFLQALNHSLAKASLFLLSGNVVLSAGSKSLRDLKGVLAMSPVWGILLTLSALAVAGAPPFGSFISEWFILSRSADLHLWWVVTALVAALALSFVAIAAHLGGVLLGHPRAPVKAIEMTGGSFIPLILVAGCLLLGFVTGSAGLSMVP